VSEWFVVASRPGTRRRATGTRLAKRVESSGSGRRKVTMVTFRALGLVPLRQLIFKRKNHVEIEPISMYYFTMLI
jgi:hypothetical protein